MTDLGAVSTRGRKSKVRPETVLELITSYLSNKAWKVMRQRAILNSLLESGQECSLFYVQKLLKKFEEEGRITSRRVFPESLDYTREYKLK